MTHLTYPTLRVGPLLSPPLRGRRGQLSVLSRSVR